MLARTASIRLPDPMATSSPVEMSVATARKGIGKASMSGSATWRLTNSPIFSPSIRPERGNTGSTSEAMPCQPMPRNSFSSSSSLPAANIAPTKAPMLVPATTSIRTPASTSARSTPMWARPRAEPLPSARPTRLPAKRAASPPDAGPPESWRGVFGAEGRLRSGEFIGSDFLRQRAPRQAPRHGLPDALAPPWLALASRSF